MGGLDYGWPGRFFLESAVGVATAGEDQELVIELCERGLALHNPARHSAADRRWLVETRIRALLAEGRSEDALALTEKEGGALDQDALSEFRMLAFFQAKRFEEAVEFAEAWHRKDSGNPRVMRLLSRAYREAGRGEDMSRTLEALRENAPADARTHVFIMIQEFMGGHDERGRELLDDFIFRHGGTQTNFPLAAEPLAEIGRLDELDILIAAAKERGIRDFRLPAARLDALISARRWAEATQEINGIRSTLPAGSLGRTSLLDLMQYLIAAASDPADGAQSGLTDYVRERQLPMSAYRRCVDVLRKTGRIDTARQIVTFAEGVFPANKYLVDTRIELESEIAARAAAIEAAKPVAVAAPTYASAEKFYEKLGEVTRDQGYEIGLSLIRELRKSRPAWIQSEAEPLARRELELQAMGSDLVALQAACRRYLNNDRVRIQNTVRVATSLHDEKRLEEARIVLAEVLKVVPTDAQATRLMRTWFPPAPASKAASAAAAAAKPEAAAAAAAKAPATETKAQ